MSLLPPWCNHQGRSKRRKTKSQAIQKVYLEHTAYLQKLGVKPKGTKKLKVKPYERTASLVREPSLPPTSDAIPGYVPLKQDVEHDLTTVEGDNRRKW